ncbi:hypothetical protein GCM10010317_050240 [Streptomyces mirabilis]|nr:hypothetical protein GCM10010317_050240 [Streptomyces mirabilis]
MPRPVERVDRRLHSRPEQTVDLPGVPLPTATKLDDWLDRLRAAVRRHTMYKQAWDALGSRIPVFV